MVSPFSHMIENILSYREVLLALGLVRAVLYALIGVMVLFGALHVLYCLGRRTPLYRNRVPVDGWNRRFFGSLVILLVILLILAWYIGSLVKR